MKPHQQGLDFGAFGPGDGLEAWRKEQEERFREMARKLGLPLGREAEVWLKDGVRLRGRLELAELELIQPGAGELRLRVGQTTFKIGEMDSCLRRDS